MRAIENPEDKQVQQIAQEAAKKINEAALKKKSGKTQNTPSSPTSLTDEEKKKVSSFWRFLGYK